MQPLRQSTWIVPEQNTSSEFLKALAEAFTTEIDTVRTFRRSWFDTFDWRLFRKKRLLLRESPKWIIQDFKGKEYHSITYPGKPLFADQFPVSDLRKKLKSICSIRALIELGQEKVSTTDIKILNSDGKVVAVVTFEESRVQGIERPRLLLTLQEIRGYQKQYQGVAATLQRLGGESQTSPVTSFELLTHSNGYTPLDYKSGYDVLLDPLMPADEAVSRIYLSLLDSMHKNQQGAVDGIDTEFLHDLRVAVRRTRSALTLIKNVLKKADSDHFKQEFRLIGQVTGPVRDLDVYLLNEKKFRKRLPQRLQEGLDFFFRDISDRRAAEQKELIQFLVGSRYSGILGKWQELFEKKRSTIDGRQSTTPILQLANKIILKRFKRILRDGYKIEPETPDEDLHRLRIQCKKLRYALEFFSSLYNRKRMKKLITHLKKLQNNLGDFNDLSVQQEVLSHYLASLKPGSKKSKETAASIGGLMTALAGERRNVRSHFEESFAEFTGKDNLDIYHKLFTPA